ncbi:MAG: beta-lactamase family protein [bacterium]|nr:beta-lactamase family protein [bacterium]
MSKKLYYILIIMIWFLPVNCQKDNSPTSEGQIDDSNNNSGSTTSRTSAIISQINSWINSGEIVGAEILIIENDETILHHASGWMDIERERRLIKNTVFRLFSNTKPIAATALLMLAEEGRLSVTDPVSLYIESFDNDNSRDVKIYQLLTHTAGYNYQCIPNAYDSLRELADHLGYYGPENPSGQQYMYSDEGSSIVSAIIAEVSGMPAEDYIFDNIIVPLEMSDTFCNLTDDEPRRSRISCTYALSGQEWYLFWDKNSPQVAKYFRGYSGIYSTVKDYLKFMKMWKDQGLYNSIRFLEPETIDEALTPTQLSINADFPYGYHWYILDDNEPVPSFGHTGFAGTLAWADPERDLLVAVFTQCIQNPNVTYIDMKNLVEDALY